MPPIWPRSRAGIARAQAIVQGVTLARDLVNTPANRMTPVDHGQRAAALAAETGLKIDVLGRAKCKALGMGIFMAVAEESEEEPKLIVLEHNADQPELPTVVLVGKGVTFDSGGISIKPAEDMWKMKGDMAGAAAVIATLGVAARLNLPLHVVGLAPCAENLPGGRAQKPGDVFTGMTGKTMEVISTDAEGRMLLADALAYAGKFNPAAVVDIATLTGAQSIALGPQAAAVFCNDDEPGRRAAGCGRSVRRPAMAAAAVRRVRRGDQEPGGRREELAPAASPASAPAPSSWSTSPRAIPGRTWIWLRWPGARKTSRPSPKAPQATVCGCSPRSWSGGTLNVERLKLNV